MITLLVGGRWSDVLRAKRLSCESPRRVLAVYLYVSTSDFAGAPAATVNLVCPRFLENTSCDYNGSNVDG